MSHFAICAVFNVSGSTFYLSVLFNWVVKISGHLRLFLNYVVWWREQPACRRQSSPPDQFRVFTLRCKIKHLCVCYGERNVALKSEKDTKCRPQKNCNYKLCFCPSLSDNRINDERQGWMAFCGHLPSVQPVPHFGRIAEAIKWDIKFGYLAIFILVHFMKRHRKIW